MGFIRVRIICQIMWCTKVGVKLVYSYSIITTFCLRFNCYFLSTTNTCDVIGVVADLYVEKMRYAAVKCMCRSYRPTLPVSYIAQVLGFSSVLLVEPSGKKDTDGLDECVEWLKAHGACLITDNSGEMLLDSKVCKKKAPKLAFVCVSA